MLEKVKKIYNRNSLFLTAYSAYLIFFIALWTGFARYIQGRPIRIIEVAILFLLFLKECSGRELKAPSIIFGGLCLMQIILEWYGFRRITFDNLFWILAFMFCGRDIEFKKIARVTVVLSTIALIGVIASSQIGLIPDYLQLDAARGYRHQLGFLATIVPTTMLFNIAALLLYEKRDKFEWWKIIAITASAVIAYKLNDVRTSFYTIMLIVIGAVLLKFHHSFRKILRGVGAFLQFSVGVCAILSVYLVNIFTGGGTLQKINLFFGNRIWWARDSCEQFGLSLFAREIPWTGNGLNAYGKNYSKDYLYVDNLYIKNLQLYGCILFVIMIIVCSVAMVECFILKDYCLLIILSILAFHALIDDMIFPLQFNTFSLLIGRMLYTILMKKREKRRLKKHTANVAENL